MFEINECAKQQGAKKCWISTSTGQLNYGRQWQRCHALLEWCNSFGIQQGALVLVAVQNELEQAALLTGLISIGRAPVLIDVDGTLSEIQSILKDVDYSGIIAELAFIQKWQLDVSSTPWLKVVAIKKQGTVFGRLLSKKKEDEDVTTWPAMAENKPETPILETPSDGLAYLIFTSGTTSKPKGVLISRGALKSQLEVLQHEFSIDSNSRLLNVLPMYHADGFVQGPVSAWAAGATLFRPAHFSATTIQRVMDSIYKDRITHMIAVPTMLSLIHRLGIEFAENFKSSDFKFIVSCAGHLETELWTNFESTFSVKICNLYGLTETVTSVLISGAAAPSRCVGTLGLPVNSTIRIVDFSGDDVSDGIEGELLISGPQIMDGYYKNPQATESILKEGWLFSGDLVKRNSDGHVELVGRLKNLIISGGRNISPEEVSAVLNQHPGVSESTVLGAPDPDWGETVAALVILNSNVTEAELVDWCRERLTEYKVPRRIIQVQEFEKGPSGKIKIEAARTQLITHQKLTSQANNNTDIELTVLQEAARCFRVPVNQLGMESGPENTAGWNSLEHMELVVGLEGRLGLKFSAREIMQIDNLGTATKLCKLKAIP